MLSLFISGGLQGAYGHPNPGTDHRLDAISWVLPSHSVVSKAVVACSYLTVSTFAITWGPTSWAYPSEIFPSKVRAKAVSLATASNWAFNCALAFAVPPLIWKINWKVYMIFAGFNAMAFLHMFVAAPETKGKTLEEMDEVFESGRPPWRSAPEGSRLDGLQQDIEDGNVKVKTPAGATSIEHKP